jgi:hypothetical protein
MAGYRPPSRPPKGRWARWLHHVRRQRDWSQTQAFEALLAAGMAWSPKSRASYLAIDMGDREPKADEIPILTRVFGAPDDSVVAPQEEHVSGDRLDRLLQTVETLLAELEEERRRAAAREEVLLALVATALGPKARQVAAEQLGRADTRPVRPG